MVKTSDRIQQMTTVRSATRLCIEDEEDYSTDCSGALQCEVVGCMVSHNKQPGDNCTTF